VNLAERIQTHFTERLLPDAVFQIAPGHLSAIRVARGDGSVKAGFVLPFRERPVFPSFDRPNVTDPAALEDAIAQAKKSLRLASGSAALLIPEPSVRVFVLGVDAFPGSGKERDAFIRWRIGKLMPLIPDDARIDYAATPGRGARKVIVAMADPGWTLYRQKDVGSPAGDGVEDRADNIVREAENTLRFLEDKENAGIGRIWLRTSIAAERPALLERLKERIALPIEPVAYEAPEVWTEAHKAVLAPLMGQVL
jgi:hypothetical protein